MIMIRRQAFGNYSGGRHLSVTECFRSPRAGSGYLNGGFARWPTAQSSTPVILGRRSSNQSALLDLLITQLSV